MTSMDASTASAYERATGSKNEPLTPDMKNTGSTHQQDDERREAHRAEHLGRSLTHDAPLGRHRPRRRSAQAPACVLYGYDGVVDDHTHGHREAREHEPR